jgi:probable selenium-dependent hydroxylase accessory protein YqeC
MFREPGILATTSQEARELLKHQSIVIVGSPVENGKIAGLVEEQVYELTQIADIVLVEADGSKRLPLKVPADHEPVIPNGTDRIILVAGLSGIGTRLSMSCHRAELTSDLLEVSKEHVIRPEDIGRMIRKGYLGKPILGNSQVTVLLNQADDIDLRRTGEDIAKLLTPYSCVIAKLNEE